MSTTQLSERDEHDFHVISGTIFSLATTLEYLDATDIVMRDRKANYIANKSKQAENACQMLYERLLREFTKTMSHEEKKVTMDGIEAQKNLVYSFFSLDGTDQTRVMGLIHKLKKEKQS